MFAPTPALLGKFSKRASRWLPLDSKRGNKDFYKGRGGRLEGSHTNKGAFVLRPERLMCIVPPDPTGFTVSHWGRGRRGVGEQPCGGCCCWGVVCARSRVVPRASPRGACAVCAHMLVSARRSVRSLSYRPGSPWAPSLGCSTCAPARFDPMPAPQEHASPGSQSAEANPGRNRAPTRSFLAAPPQAS